LDIEHLRRGLTTLEVTHADVFTTRVNHGHPGRIAKEGPEAVKGTDRERVDDVQVIFGGDLDQAEFRPKCVFANEFRVKRDDGRLGNLLKTGGKLGRLRDQVFGQPVQVHRL
jgi:hypothetical protein